MKTQDRLMTVDEFEKVYVDQPYELIEGRVIKVSPTVQSHGAITGLIAYELIAFLKGHPLGRVYGAETGFQLSNITMRAPDVAFAGNAKLKLITDPDKFLPFAPDLAVEVVSPSDRAAKVKKKIELFMAAGTPLFWVIYLKTPRVVVHTQNSAPKTIGLDGVLDGGDVLPGLQIHVADLFPSAP